MIDSTKTYTNLQIQHDMFELITQLYPICRSITGNGVRKTLAIINKHINLNMHEVPTNTQVFDWSIPKEWNINDAYIIDPYGNKIIDFKKSNLHIVSYSIPIRTKINLNELKNHLYTLPNQPDLIPYVTSYYKENWGFCIPYNQFKKLENGTYEICIDSSLENGNLTYGEYYIPGKTQNEFLISTYICHPSLCNDNISGIVLTTFLAKYLNTINHYYSYRFLFVPETIGSLTWLSFNEKNLSQITHGLVVTCVGDKGKFTYKKSRQGDAEIDHAVENVLKKSNTNFQIVDFFPSGSDERQYCSPGFNLPVGSLMRTPYHRFPEYHTSADNLNFISTEYILESLVKYIEIVTYVEQNHNKPYRKHYAKKQKKNEIGTSSNKEKFVNLFPQGEPQLGKRGLYRNSGIRRLDNEKSKEDVEELAILWMLNLSDGKNNLSDIAKRSNLKLETIKKAAKLLTQHGLIKKI